MAQQKPFNLFTYGTLMNPSVFHAVLGKRLVRHTGRADDAGWRIDDFDLKRALNCSDRGE